MTAQEGLFISDALHEAMVEVDEKGTEAAAATAVVLNATGLDAALLQFRADHPFLFLIRDQVTGSILFIGRLAEP